MKNSLIKLQNKPTIISAASVVGKYEHEGPLGDYFDIHDMSDKFGQTTWEKAESEMQRLAMNLALSKIKFTDSDIDCIFAGDLINQCTSSAYGLLEFDTPMFGLYGACSTAAESIMLSALLVNAGIYNRTAAVTSSHYCSAERQFRYPLECGGQRPPTAQWTATGSGAFIIGNDTGIFITEVLPGRSIDKSINDASNMGAAMAPAAIDTLTRYFHESGNTPDVFDLIVTGDLGAEGYAIVLDYMKKEGFNIDNNYSDCGLMLYNRSKHDVHAGASGCGCSAIVLAGFLTDQLKSRKLNDILFIGTGALMSPLSIQQGQSIPGIAHLLRIQNTGSD